VCLEPDPRLAEELRASLERASLDGRCEIAPGTLSDLEDDCGFDAVLYLDVLEHIYEDRAELARAASLLRPGGALVVLAPAHGWLWTSFDRAIGHHRRYTRSTLRAIVPEGLQARLLIYLDSMGLLASLANRWLLRQATPTARQIAVWDRILVPISRYLDPLLCHLLGKSVLGVWEKASGVA
jgi:SAM-dependent methyltransferase